MARRFVISRQVECDCCVGQAELPKLQSPPGDVLVNWRLGGFDSSLCIIKIRPRLKSKTSARMSSEMEPTFNERS